MNITFKATHHEVTENERALLIEKFASIEKLLGRYGSAAELDIEIAITADGEKHGAAWRAESNLSAGGALYRAEASASNLISAVEAARRALEEEIRSRRGRAHTLWKRGRAAIKNMLRGG